MFSPEELEEFNRAWGTGPAADQWHVDLRERLGYTPGKWNGRQHSADQIVGILRELEDGEDPYAEERNGTVEDWVSQVSGNRHLARDDRDGELRKLVDAGTWMVPPNDPRRTLQRIRPTQLG